MYDRFPGVARTPGRSGVRQAPGIPHPTGDVPGPPVAAAQAVWAPTRSPSSPKANTQMRLHRAPSGPRPARRQGGFCLLHRLSPLRVQREKAPSGRKPAEGPRESRRRPTLPHRHQCSTIGAAELNCRVRNGNGCFPRATVTGKPEQSRFPSLRPLNQIHWTLRATAALPPRHADVLGESRLLD